MFSLQILSGDGINVCNGAENVIILLVVGSLWVETRRSCTSLSPNKAGETSGMKSLQLGH